MTSVAIHIVPAIPWQARWVDFFATGLKRHGVDVTITTSRERLPNCEIAILFGPNAWKAVEAVGQPQIMVNRKFFGEEQHVAGDIVALSWSGFNGLGYHCVNEVSPDRLLKFLDPEKQIQEWKPTGKHFLLCGQADLARCTKYKSLDAWYTQVKKMVGAPIRFRPHPTRGQSRSLEEDLRDVKAAIVLNSTVSLDILRTGVPVITMDEGDAAYGITGHTLDDIRYPERLPLLQHLAHCQWHYTEIEDGSFWEQLYPKSGKRLCEFTNP